MDAPLHVIPDHPDVVVMAHMTADLVIDGQDEVDDGPERLKNDHGFFIHDSGRGSTSAVSGYAADTTADAKSSISDDESL